MKKSIFIKDRQINEGKDIFIIAEAGVNHNGELEKALSLVDIASQAGADAVKFQTFKSEEVVTEKGKMANYQKRNLGKTISQRDMLAQFELNEKFYKYIIKRCKEKNILFLSTPHGGTNSVDFLEKIKIKCYKIGSGDLTNYILLKKIAKLSKPIILSTGMATLKEVKDSVNFIKSCGNKKIAVLHCTTSYPCPIDQVNLSAMTAMMKELDVPVGYSDHTLDMQVAVMAAAFGAAIYECHFTIDKRLPGPDHIASSSPEVLREKIKAIRKVKKIMGKGKKGPTAKEKKYMINLVRKSIVAKRDLIKGQKINIDDIEAKRPGDGLSPIYFHKILGKKIRRDVKMDEQI